MARSPNPACFLNEVMTPKQDSEDIEADLEKFVDKYTRSLDHGFVICITDNPMGMLSFEAMETIETVEVPVEPEQLVVHLNTFHRKVDLDRMLATMAERGVKYILAVSGDGNERLHRLEPDEMGFDTVNITSVELLRYIEREYPDTFTLGVAFNHYEPREAEREKMARKLDAGATFVITQPVIRRSDNVDWLGTLGVPIFVEAWMTKRIDLVAECVGYELPPEDLDYDPITNLGLLRQNYPDFGVYMAFLGMKKQILKLADVQLPGGN
jgi:methylenetetrahydrofolate reductase (NADPH)